MARLGKDSEHRISLFPMFNILICTLGVLVFILSTVATLSLGVGKTIIITPEKLSGIESRKIPTFIEWNGTELILYPSRYTIKFGVDIRRIATYQATYSYIDEKITGTPLGAVFEDIYQNRDEEYIIVLVRPSGFHNFYHFRGYIESKGIDLGYEPVNQEWILRIQEIE